MILAFWKPYGVLSQFTTEEGSSWTTLADYAFPPDVYSIGRLDADSEGLLLLTDEPSVTATILAGKQPHERTYAVQVEGIITDTACKKLSEGVMIRGYRTKVARASVIADPGFGERIPPIRTRAQIPTSWLELRLTEGKNRQVRRMTAAVGYPTLRLIRTSIGEINLDGLAVGCWRFCTDIERRALRCLPGISSDRKNKAGNHRNNTNPNQADERFFGKLDGKGLFRRR
jgi:23S rRNA pseudouridine2457 synthase